MSGRHPHYPALEMTVAWSRYPWVRAALRRKIGSLVMPVPGETAIALAERCSTNLYRPGSVVFYRGHCPVTCFLLRHGSILLECGQGSRAARGILVEGPAVLGHWHAVRRSAFPVTARAVTQAVVAVITLVQCAQLRFSRTGEESPVAGL